MALSVNITIVKDVTVQGFLDGVFPSVLPLLLLVVTWILMVKKHAKATHLIIIYIILAFIGAFTGII